jgi:type VI secretion system protein ImpC
MVRDKIGSSMTQAQLQTWLNEWIKKYIEASPDIATEEAKAMRPLSAAEVVVEEDPSNPGYYTSKIFLKPHYQLEGLTVSLRLVSKLPSQKG